MKKEIDREKEKNAIFTLTCAMFRIRKSKTQKPNLGV